MSAHDWIDTIIDVGSDVEDGQFAVVVRNLADNSCHRGKTYTTLKVACAQATRTGIGESIGYVVERRGADLTLWVGTRGFLRQRNEPAFVRRMQRARSKNHFNDVAKAVQHANACAFAKPRPGQETSWARRWMGYFTERMQGHARATP